MHAKRFMRRTSAKLYCVALAVAIVSSGAEATPVANLSRTQVNYGKVPLDVNIVQPVFLTNTGDAPLVISGLLLAGGSAFDFTVGGTCVVPITLLPGERCRIDVALGASSTVPLSRQTTLNVQSNTAPAAGTVTLGGSADAAIVRGFQATPAWIDFPNQAVGTAAGTQVITFSNPEPIAIVLDSAAMSGGDATDFTPASTCGVGTVMTNGTPACTATVGFVPTAAGPRASELAFAFHLKDAPAIKLLYFVSITGVGGPAPPAPKTTVVEYYNASLDHYFITWVTAEQANLDAGKTPTRWVRTGNSFNTYTVAQSGTSSVCRYYIPPEKGDSHFFGRGAAECAATGQKNPTFLLEDSAFMNMFLPINGVCAAGSTAVYRVFSNRPDANHRYMTDKTVRDNMVSKGWVAEGDGPDLVVMCAP